MDIIKYQQDRDQDLALFNKEYKEAKVQYVNMLNQAMHEQEPSKQAALVKQVLSLNSGLAQYVRDFISQSRGKFDTAMLEKLTKDILQYQQDFQKIQTASDKSQTLRGILNKEKIELEALQSTFDFWLYALLGAVALVLILIFRTSLVQLSAAAESLVPDISTEEMELPLEEPDEPLYKISLA
jgi:hypothetical protein